GHLDVVVAIADVAVDAENAANVHRAFELRFDRPELNPAILCDRGNARREAAGETDQHVLNRRDAVILRGENLGMIRLERSLGFVLLLLAETEKSLHLRLTVGSVLPFAGRTPRELCRFW